MQDSMPPLPLSRRQFLKTSAVLGVGAVAASAMWDSFAGRVALAGPTAGLPEIKASAQSTDHAARGYTSAPGIAPHSLYLENGSTPVAEIIKGLDRAFYLTDTGAFGYDPATGGWSYQASGLMIEKGEIANPVTDVSLASDTLTMLKGVLKVGNDLKFDGQVNAPHLLIEEMALSGT